MDDFSSFLKKETGGVAADAEADADRDADGKDGKEKDPKDPNRWW